jgi:F-type H+-transporting ATPase subunit epsilon
MRLEIVTPARAAVDRAARRIVAEGPEGHFGILPRHGDFVSALVPGILLYEPAEGGAERFVAVQSGTLVKCGARVRIAVGAAIESDDLAMLRDRVAGEFRRQDETERATRTALARLEAGMFHRFRDLGGRGA